MADSSCECEDYAYSAGVKDMESVRLLIRDLCALGVDLPEIPTLFVDCEPAIAVANGASTRSRTKHIDFKVWLCRDYVGRKVVQHTYSTADSGFFHQAAGARALRCLSCALYEVSSYSDCLVSGFCFYVFQLCPLVTH